MEEKDKTLLDSINLLYVAMTRPEERLFVFSPSPPEQNQAIRDTVPAFFFHYLLNRDPSLVRKTRDVYEFGTPSPHTEKKKRQEVAKRLLSNMISSDWRDKVLIRTSAPEAWDIADPQKNFPVGKPGSYCFFKDIESRR
jgi:ATP-dependent exoDNAse (exonuclease V) beta subunit